MVDLMKLAEGADEASNDPGALRRGTSLDKSKFSVFEASDSGTPPSKPDRTSMSGRLSASPAKSTRSQFPTPPQRPSAMAITKEVLPALDAATSPLRDNPFVKSDSQRILDARPSAPAVVKSSDLLAQPTSPALRDNPFVKQDSTTRMATATKSREPFTMSTAGLVSVMAAAAVVLFASIFTLAWAAAAPGGWMAPPPPPSPPGRAKWW